MNNNNNVIKGNLNNIGFELEREKYIDKNDKNSDSFKKIIQPIRKYSEQNSKRKSIDNIINNNNNIKALEIIQIKSDEIKSKIFIYKQIKLIINKSKKNII